jgi:hypothetical protein
VDFVGIVFYGLPMVIIVACVVWFVKLYDSQQKGERFVLKWREIDPSKKALAVLVVVWTFLNLYLEIGDWLALLNGTSLPLGSVYSVYRPTWVYTWATTSSIVGLVLIFSMRFPKRSTVP